MKKIILLILVLFTAEAHAQTVTYALTAGFNYSNVSGNGNPNTTLLYSISNSYQAGFHLGGLVDIGFKNLSLQPGIIYITMGGQNATSSESEKISLTYIQVPINLLYKINADDGQFFIGGGPYIGVGLTGTYSYTELFVNPPYHGSENLGWGDQYFPLHSPEIGLNFLMGFKFKSGVAVNAGYGLGLTDAYNGGANNKNNVLSASVSYFFQL